MVEQKNKRVMLIDNDDDVLNVVKEALVYEGYEVDGFTETDDVFSLLDRHKPDIVILDYILNGINGGELCHQIKANKGTSEIPVIIMSAYPRVIQSLGNYGCNEFISKPFDLWHFVGCITELTNYNHGHLQEKSA